ncbi:hypothetical protein PsorP6_019019 [Peronosclerospora sorghi]|nr:hypothetical protein PsorP6_019019 [Peronosclerospora sorghi]
MSSTLASGLSENEIQALQANASSKRNELEQLRDEKTSLEKELAQLASTVEQYENELPKIKLDINLKGERQEEPEPPSEQKAEDTGHEMQNDFEGTMHDMPDDGEGKQNESEDREELDREMGDFDQNDENVVEEKLWGEDSDDDEDRIDEEKLKFWENYEVKGEALKDEVRGKDGAEKRKDQSTAKDEDKHADRKRRCMRIWRRQGRNRQTDSR